ncbi:cytochrome-c peroxidase [Rhodoplanes elegans]|nr:cytochrome c peroxidase [Rhodoplanes elegans]
MRRSLVAVVSGALTVVILTFGMLAAASDHDPAAPDRDAAARASPLREPITPIGPAPDADPAKLALGERLFADPRLSGNGRRSCMSCHDLSTNGATGNRLDTALDGTTTLPLNTGTVFNAALAFRLNWEGAYRTFESQVEASFVNPLVMGTTMDAVVARLDADPDMVGRFRAAYGRGPDAASLLDALATFLRSLVTPGSRFDRWLAGESGVLTAREVEGYRLFKQLGCIACHQGAAVGANMFQRHGIFRPLASPEPAVVRVPSLRNVVATAPYFHDGSAPTLADAVRRMGVAQLDHRLDDGQVSAIVDFLGTLTGEYRNRRVEPPP